MRKKRFTAVLRLFSDVMYAFGFFLIIPTLIGIFLKEYDQAITFAAGVAIFIPLFSVLRLKLKNAVPNKNHGAMALALCWLSLSLVSSIPFIVNGMSVIDALFEAFSAWTDTGLTMIPDPSQLPYSLSTFRILMQWVSGLGLVLFILALRGQTASGARSFFQAEGRPEDFGTDVMEMGKRIVLIYVGYTLAGFAAFLMLGLPFFDALMHAITSLSTGGFSTNPVGVGFYGILPTIVAIILMLAGGISFNAHYYLVNGKKEKFFKNAEIQTLAFVVVTAIFLVMVDAWVNTGNFFSHALENIFYVVSAVTTAGAGTTLALADVSQVFQFIITLLMISGAVTGSTTGGIKLWRLIILWKTVKREIRRPFEPEGAVMPIRVGDEVIPEKIVQQALLYTGFYLMIGLLATLFFMYFGYPGNQALFTIFSAQSNVGLNAIPEAGYYSMPVILKMLVIVLMLLGRMEIFPMFFVLRSTQEKV
ncbi:MAG: TrkH family potassium uptake protein [Anaerolineaceae bacterium]|nr:TrkH family potassium uptake protein [Anaerolineaceae bacterium]